MMSKPDNNDQPEWEQILRSLEQGYEVTEDRLNELTVDERAYISEITDKQKLGEAVASLEAIDLKADWGLVSSQLDEASVNKRTVALFSKWARYAAILFLPVALTVGLYLTLSDKQPKQDQLARKHENRGANKVTLILGDGREIELDSQQSIKTSDGTQIQTDADHGLVYTTEKNENRSAIFNTLVIPKGADYKLLLDDLTEIWLNSDSRIKYQVNFNATKTREVYLEKGEAYFKVAKNPNKPFIVRSALMSLQVLGTSFNMNTYSNEVQTTLVEGKVKLESFGSREQMLLNPGQQGNFDKFTGSLKKQDVDVFPFVAWKDGIIVFQNENMGELMAQLGRLYDYEIEFKDQSLKQLHYTGRADKSESIQNILAIIQETANLKFMIKERRITVGKQ
ncbi:FecR family protein [Pedobacter nyackensis]|uniref:FecR family protein n=1 Tax=Pedobacter nyackensis TaxID=475255 RepID=A0A1W2CRI4_9SPHI|nr:FecR domain-containing protein [Pedobacter nyackensis]SMC87492.1 FecR family protein [Pedobacter nyackensis]